MSGMKKWQHLKIPFEEIKLATNNFETCIGKGGYGWVYKGQLSISGKLTTVAVKRLNENLGQGLKEFLTEIDVLCGQQHPNLVSLLGYCDDKKEKIIVYEYAERGSLDRYITTHPLTWSERLKICYDVACGLDHLHNHVGQHQTIIHRDIKSANILLDHDGVAKISDLGLSRLSLAGLDRSLVISHACGTPGYCEPEYIISGTVTKKSDVYSFGMVLFEVLCGKLCSFKEKDGVLLSAKVVKHFYKKNKLDQIVDPSLREQYLRSDSMAKFSAVAYRCLHEDREQRPSIDVVMKELLKIQEEAYSMRKLSRGWKVLASLKKSTSSLLPKGLWFDQITKNPFIMGRSSENDELFWFRDIGKYDGGEYSIAVVQANQVLEDQCQIESGSFGTFVGVYDGHGGPDAARYVCDNLFRNFQEASAKDYGVVTPATIENAFLQTENGFTARVSQIFNEHPQMTTVGSCCLVGVIYQQTLFIANLGDSRVILGKKGKSEVVVAIQLSSEHIASLEEVRHELKSLHPHDPDIVTYKHGIWRVKGIIQVTRSIGDVYLKHSEYQTDQLPQKFRLREPIVRPILSATPSIVTHHIEPSDSFLIFASDGLWEHLSNEEAVEIVHNNPRAGIARKLVKAALDKAAMKREMTYSELIRVEKGVRRHFHDDTTVIVLFLDCGPHSISLRCEL